MADRPATVVLAARPDGKPAQRLVGRRRHRLAAAPARCSARGQVERSVRFSSIEIGERDGRTMSPPDERHEPHRGEAHVAARRVPRAGRARRVRTGRRAHAIPTACCCSTATVCSPRRCSSSRAISTGARSRAAAPTTQLADTRTRTYHEASGDVAVWERNGLVYTCVTDAPSDVFSGMVGALASEGREHARGDRRLRARPLRLGLTAQTATNLRRSSGSDTPLNDAGSAEYERGLAGDG